MKKKIVVSLGTLGMAIPSLLNGMSPPEAKHLGSKIVDFTPSKIRKDIHINPKTIEVVKEIASHEAFLINDEEGSIYIDLSKLPRDLRDELSESQEVVEIPESCLLKLDQGFANVLATQNAFKRTETLEGVIINQIMLNKLKQDATPILKEDMQRYLTTSFTVIRG